MVHAMNMTDLEDIGPETAAGDGTAHMEADGRRAPLTSASLGESVHGREGASGVGHTMKSIFVKVIDRGGTMAMSASAGVRVRRRRLSSRRGRSRRAASVNDTVKMSHEFFHGNSKAFLCGVWRIGYGKMLAGGSQWAV